MSIFITLVIIFIIPVMVYGLFSALFGLKEPEKKRHFMIGVLVQKVGTSIGFVGLLFLGGGHFINIWVVYSLVWFLMFALNEIGQAIMSDYSKKESAAGIISEAIYFPLAGAVVASITKWL